MLQRCYRGGIGLLQGFYRGDIQFMTDKWMHSSEQLNVFLNLRMCVCVHLFACVCVCACVYHKPGAHNVIENVKQENVHAAPLIRMRVSLW